MSELEQNVMYVDEPDFAMEDCAIDKEIVIDEDEIVPVKPDEHGDFDVVNLPVASPEGFAKLTVDEKEAMEPTEITDLRDQWDAKEFGADEEPPMVGHPINPETEKMLNDWSEKRKGKERVDERGAIVVDEDLADEGEIIPGSNAKFEEEKEEDNAKDQKVTDWPHDGDHSKFIVYIVERKNSIPKHSGETIPGCERAKSYLKSLDNEISKAMRTDLKGIIDEQQIDAIRKEISKMIERLDRQINKLKKKQRKADLEVRLVSEGQCEKCSSVTPMWHDIKNDKMVCMHCDAESDIGCSDCDGLEKTANTPILNVYMNPWENAVVRTIINATVSGGKNIEEVYEKLKKDYDFTPREDMAIQQLIADFGYPVYKDRGRIDEKDADPADGKGVDWNTNYHA
ncbi:MAG: hypothetical protein WC523_03635 [Patescibacteria group bacterium]